MIFPGMQQSKTRISGASQPKLVEKATGQLFILVRDDVSVNGKLYVAPVGMMTSMTSIKPDDFKKRFEWYVDPANRPIQVGPPEVVAGGPAGPFVPLSVVEATGGVETVEGQPIEQAAEAAALPQASSSRADAETPSAAVEAPKNKGGRPKGRKDRKKRKSPVRSKSAE